VGTGSPGRGEDCGGTRSGVCADGEDGWSSWMRSMTRATSRRDSSLSWRDVAVMRAKLTMRGGAGVGDAIARELGMRRRAGMRGWRCGSGWRIVAARRRACRHARGVSRDGAGADLLAQLIEETQLTLDRGEQVIILLKTGAGYSFVVMVPELRREDRVRELRDLQYISQAGDGE